MILTTQITYSFGSSAESCQCCCWKVSSLAYYHIVYDLCNLKRSKTGSEEQSLNQLSSHTESQSCAGATPSAEPSQAHENLPVWSNNTDPCPRLAIAEPLHAAMLMPGQTGTQKHVGSRSHGFLATDCFRRWGKG